MSKRYDIFISYRRTSFDIANLIAMKLSAAGYSVFVDIETLRAGKFNERLLEVIEECKDFILVLPPNALDRCVNDDDWVRTEVEHAIKHKKNIIPVMLRDFTWPSADQLPQSLHDLPMYNGITITDANLFVENIERLKRSFLLSRPNRKRWRIALYALISVAFVVVLFVLVGRKSDDASLSKSASDGTPTAESADKLSPEELRICDEYATQLMNLYMLSDSNMQLLDQTYKDWNRNLVKDKPTEENKRLFKSGVAMNRKQLHMIPSMMVFASDYAVLEKVGIYAEDIERFESSLKELHGELEEHFYTLESIASSPNLYGEYIEISKEYYLAMLEYNYCILLEIFSKMPKLVYDTVYDVTIALEFFTEKSMHYPTEEYQRMQKSLKNTIESKRRAMSGMVDNE